MKEVKIEIPETKEEHYNDRLDIYKDIASVKSRIKNDITSDFVLASLKDEEKQFVIEMTENAYFAQKLVKRIVEKATQWIWNNKEQQWEKKRLQDIDEKQYQRLVKIRDEIFDTYMNKIYMIVTLNRNVDKNHLIKILSGYKEDINEQEQTIKLQDAIKQGLADQTKKEK